MHHNARRRLRRFNYLCVGLGLCGCVQGDQPHMRAEQHPIQGKQTLQALYRWWQSLLLLDSLPK